MNKSVEDLIYDLAGKLESLAPINRVLPDGFNVPQIVIRGRETNFKYNEDTLIESTGIITLDLYCAVNYDNLKTAIRNTVIDNDYHLLDYEDLIDAGEYYHARIVVQKQIYH